MSSLIEKILGGWNNYNSVNARCTGQSAFCSFLLPNNGTKLIDQGLVNAYTMLSKATSNQKYLESNQLALTTFNMSRVWMMEDMVIVHLRILKPDIQLIDAKYSIDDKFANFGGNFGIFAEITGCSFLGILNFFIILFKLILSPWRL